MAPNALQGLLKALADPEADPNLRRRALRAYGLFLLGLKGGLLLLLAPFLPSAPYPVSYTHLTLPTNREV